MNKLKNKSRFIIDNILSVSKNSVTAVNKIDKNSKSDRFPVEILHTVDDTNCPKEIEVCSYDSEYFGPCDKSTLRHTFWIKNIHLADDIQGANVFLDLSQNTMQLKTAKEINPDEELQLWFSENILELMEIPFLAPLNIQGKNSYVCHKCCSTFEVPNKLKIHLALNCNMFDMRELWKKLLVRIKMEVNHAENFHARKPEIYPITIFHSIEKPAIGYDPLHISNFPSATPMNDSSLMAAAHLETIVSNMGTSKSHQGHLCLYCGKLYSRKYGLKIHIRTHTGFKPLKCRHCFRAFGDPSNLNKHVKLHTNHNSSNYQSNKTSSCHTKNNFQHKIHSKSKETHQTPLYPHSSNESMSKTK